MNNNLIFAFIFIWSTFSNVYANERESLTKHPEGIINEKETNHEDYSLKTNLTKSTNNSINTIFFEGFENSVASQDLAPGWQVKRTSMLNDEPEIDAEMPRWARNSDEYGFENWQSYVFSGTGSMVIGWEAPDFTWAISPSFFIPESDDSVFLSYMPWYKNGIFQGQMYYSNYYVKIKVDDQWHLLAEFIGNDNNSNLLEKPVILNLNEFKGKDVQLAFIYQYSTGWQMAIDEIFVYQQLETDFGISSLSVKPLFGLVPLEEVSIEARIQNYASQPINTNIYLFINGELVQTKTTGIISNNSAPQRIRFEWTPQQEGIFDIKLLLPQDQQLENNSLSTEVIVHESFALKENFENFDYDELGFAFFYFPPLNWTISDAENVLTTTNWQISDEASVLMAGRENMDAQYITTHLIEFSEKDKWLKFFIDGRNNSVNVLPEDYPDAEPYGIQGHSTLKVLYAESIEGPWSQLGEDIEMKSIYDEDQNLIQSANRVREIEMDISELKGNEYYLSFQTTSNFNLFVNGQPFHSYVIIDDILIGHDTPLTEFSVMNLSEEPIENAQITVFNNEDNILASRYTKDDGSVEFFLNEGEYTYVVSKNGFVNSEGSFLINNQEIELYEVILQNTNDLFNVSFHVTDENENIIKEAYITIANIQGITDDTGTFQANDLATGEYHFIINAPGYQTYKDKVTITENEPDNIVNAKLFNLPTHNNLVLNHKTDFLKCFPNPARNYMQINANTKINYLDIYDLNSRKVMSVSPDNDKFILNLSSLNNGIYLLKAFSDDSFQTAKIQIIR